MDYAALTRKQRVVAWTMLIAIIVAAAPFAFVAWLLEARRDS